MPESPHRASVQGTGVGLRRALMGPLAEAAETPAAPAFLETAPENWMGIGGALGRRFRAFTERYAFVTHGLSLDIGGPRPLDEAHVRGIRQFLDAHGIADYSEHLSYTGDQGGHLYDLMPIPFTEEAVVYVAERVRRVQDLLERRIALENVSYYAAPGARMSESDFINAVIERADCDLLLDVNNVFVNSVNADYDPYAFIDSLPLQRVRYLHVAGHWTEPDNLRIDTHGAPVCDEVFALLDYTYQCLGPVPTLLERDFNIPPWTELRAEMEAVEARRTAVAAGAARRTRRPSGHRCRGSSTPVNLSIDRS